MKKFLLISLAALLAGCTSVHMSNEGGHTMVDISNSGWFLFSLLPIASGDPLQPDNAHTCDFFDNTVTLENNMKLLDYAIESNGALHAKDIVSYVTEETILFVVAKHRVYHTSAELVMPRKPIIQQIINPFVSTNSCESVNP